jgi:endonuclease YncB( thermonuclease family)
MALRGIRKIRGTSYLRTRNYGLPNKVADTKAIITDVVDGDTVTVSYTDGRTENIKIRLENINAPEITNEVTNKKSEYLGNYAKQVLSTKLVGKTVTVTGADDNYDVYGRKVAYIYDYIDTTDRTKSLNYQMVESGLARYYPFAGSYDPKILEAEMKAIASNQGVWNDPVYKYVKEELYSDLGPTIDFHTTAWRAASDKIPQIVASYYSGETSSGKTNLSADFYSTEQYQWMIKEEDRAQRAAAIYTYAPDIVEKYTSARETETPHRIEELSPADRAELNLAKAQELWRYSSIRLAGVVPSVVAGGDPSFGPGFGQPLSYTAPGWIFINMPFFGWGWSEDPEVKRAVDINILGYRLRYDTLFGSAADPEGSRALLYAPFGRTTGAFVDLFRSGDVGRFANEFLFQGSNIFSEQPQGQMVLTNMNPEGVFSSNSSVLQRNAQIYKQEMIPTPGRVEEATRPVTFGERELFVRAAKASPDWNYETGKWKNKYTEAQIYNMESLELRKWARDRLTFTLEPTWENYFKGTLAEKSVYWDYPSLDEAMYGDLQYRMPMYPQGGIDQSFEGSQIVETPAGLKNALAATMLYDLAIVPYWTANISSSLISGGARAMMGGLGAVTAKETLTGIKQGAQTLLLESAKTGLKAAAGGAGFGAAMGLAFGGGAEGGIFGAAFGAGLGFLGGFFNSAVLGFIAPIAVTGSVLADLISSTTTKKYSIGIEDNQFNAFSTPVGRTLYPYSTSDGIAESWLQDYTNNVITNWWDSPNRRAFGNNRPDEPEYGVLDVDQFNKAATGFSSFLGSFARLQGRRQITDLVSPLFTSMAEGIDDTNLAKATFKELQEKGELS